MHHHIKINFHFLLISGQNLFFFPFKKYKTLVIFFIFIKLQLIKALKPKLKLLF